MPRKDGQATSRSLQRTRVWRSMFRSGTGSSTLHRALAIQQNVFLHLFSTKVRRRMLTFRASGTLGALTLGTFFILVVTGILLMLYYHPSVRRRTRCKDLKFVSFVGHVSCGTCTAGRRTPWCSWSSRTCSVFYRRISAAARIQLGSGRGAAADYAAAKLHGLSVAWDQLAFWRFTVGSNISSAVPVFGDKVRFPDAGRSPGERERAAAFYVLHCVVLPLAAVLFVAVHMWRHPQRWRLYVRQSDRA